MLICLFFYEEKAGKCFHIQPIYSDESKRPSGFKVTHKIGNSKEKIDTLQNTPTGK